MVPFQWNMGALLFALYLITISCASAKSHKDFALHWNVPTYLCKKHSVDFKEELKNFSITFNNDDMFRGEKITILYDPGQFPIYLKNTTTEELVEHNGGIPQKGNLTLHLEALKKAINDLVPSNFSGLGVIDFEVWRPVFRQHWNAQVIYRNKSFELEQGKYSSDEKKVKEEAKKNFEKHAKDFMLQTLEKIKEMRPGAKWGYYGFPYCLNYQNGSCPEMVTKENDEIRWLFNESTALFPSVYMSKNLTEERLKSRVDGRMNETRRIAELPGACKPENCHPYVWFRYHDSDEYLSKTNMENTLKSAKEHGMGGVIMWGSSSDLKTEEQCKKLMKYLKDTLGPIYKNITSGRSDNEV